MLIVPIIFPLTNVDSASCITTCSKLSFLSNGLYEDANPTFIKNSENMKKVAKKAADTASNMPDKVNVQNKSKIPEAQKGLDDDD